MSFIDRDSVTRRIRERLNIVEVVGGYVSLKRSGAMFKALCPFHNEKAPSFQVNPSLQIFKCFGCGQGGDVFKFVQLRENVPFPEARRILAERAGIPLEAAGSNSTSPGGPTKSDLAKVNEWAQGLFRRQYSSPAGESTRAYVAGRGITTEMAADFGLGLALDRFEGLVEEARKARLDVRLLLAAGLVKQREQGGVYDTFRNRLMFPIHDIAGRLIGFGGRTLGDDPAKYLNTPSTALFDKSSNLFAIERAKHVVRQTGRMIVVEGYTDCIMAHQAGFAETVATLGTAMTDAHAALLRRLADRLVLLFDSDEAGQRAADRALSVTMKHGLEVTLARVPEGKDPCDYILSAGATAFESMLKSGLSVLEFKWRQIADEYGAQTTGPARRRATEAYLQQFATWSGQGAIDPIQQGLLVNELSRVLELPAEDVHRQLSRLRRRMGAASSSVAGGRAGNESALAADKSASGGKPGLELQAQRHLVAALVNAPEVYGELAGRFDPATISEPRLCEVAQRLLEVIGSGEPFRLDEFIGQFESPEDACLITDLQAEGERAGRYLEVVQGSLACLEDCARARQAAELGEQIRRDRQANAAAGDDQNIPEGENERLLALAERARRAHFSPTRVRKFFLND